MRQQVLWMFGIRDKNSSLIISRPPIAAMISMTPKSNKSCFLSSLSETSELKLLA